MQNMIKQIHNIMGSVEGSHLSVEFFEDEIVFYIYDTEIPVVFNGSEAYVDCETIGNHLTSDMLDDLHKIVLLLGENTDMLKALL